MVKKFYRRKLTVMARPTTSAFSSFPIDMLRYDQCAPASETNAYLIARGPIDTDSRSVDLHRYTSENKKLHRKGVLNGRAKLTETDVRKIRSRLQDGATKAAVAREFNISESSVRFISNGTTWRCVPKE